ICGPASGWWVMALLLPNPFFLRAVLSGYSELLLGAGVVWLIARHVGGDRIKPPDFATASVLSTLNLIRPESWLLSAAVGFLAAISALVSRSPNCRPGKALWDARHSLVSASI